MNHEFELGPIRPPSEAQSILLRVTRNCPWNQCTFCHTYRDERFSRRALDEVLRDIDSIHAIAQRIREAAAAPGAGGRITEAVVATAMASDPTPAHYYRQVAFWMLQGMKSLFLQDANSLILATGDLVAILARANERFPGLERITTYARAKTVAKKSLAEMKELRAAGLSRIHIGMESGSDRILELIKKGVTAHEQIVAGRNAIEAGFDLSEYYMPGVGGRDLMEENAIESARVVNAINPTFVRIRSTVPIPGTGLYDCMSEGAWRVTTEVERVRELRLFIERLEGVTSRLLSDHIMNLLEDVEGALPDDKDAMLATIDSFLGMADDDRESFIIGRRLGRYRGVKDFYRDPEIESVKREIKSRYASVDEAILEILKNYI
ncbi:MAG TPA: radical SAM protein [Spirochaetota bacterium]|nr:radical SAM protein [Spirochaetota bacterium]HNT09284.1 radical SAM protein [Spirochaetota bacterium]